VLTKNKHSGAMPSTGASGAYQLINHTTSSLAILSLVHSTTTMEK
jgi:hypothetical protein